MNVKSSTHLLSTNNEPRLRFEILPRASIRPSLRFSLHLSRATRQSAGPGSGSTDLSSWVHFLQLVEMWSIPPTHSDWHRAG